MAVRRTRAAAAAAAICVAIALLWHLRDPPWVASMTSGMSGWSTDSRNVAFRWGAGRSSFFVPADWRIVTLPLRVPIDAPDDWPVTADILIDDRLAERVTFRDGAWRHVDLRLPSGARRRFRRIDIRLDRVPREGHGIQIGEARTR